MESTRIRAPFDRAGDNDERREEREHVGMGDSSGTLIAVWLQFSGLPPDTYLCASERLGAGVRREHARGLGHEADGAARPG
jgi:hypothetical protein